MTKFSWVGGALFLGALAIGATTGCSSAEPESEPSASSENELGRDPANCYFHSRFRKYETTCRYDNARASAGAVEEAIINATGVGSCAGVVFSIVQLTASTVSVVFAPAVIPGAAIAVANAGACGLYITDVLRRIVPSSCTTFEVAASDQERTNACAMACGGTERVYNGDCYCGRVPLACNDPVPTVTPTPSACNVNWGDGCFNTTACPLSGGRANCSGTGYASRGQKVLNMEGTRYYSCTTSGWRGCR